MVPTASRMAEQVKPMSPAARLIGHILLGEGVGTADKAPWLEFLSGSADACRRTRSHAVFFGSAARWGDDLLSIIPPWAQLDGLIVQAQSARQPDIGRILASGLQTVFFGRLNGVSEDKYAWVDFNYEEGVHRACRFLSDLGHRHIALIQGDAGHPASSCAFRGIARAAGRGTKVQVLQDIFGPREAAEAVTALLAAADAPTSMIWRGDSLDADLTSLIQHMPQMAKLALVDVGQTSALKPAPGVTAHLRGNMMDAGRRSVELLGTLLPQGQTQRRILLPLDLILGHLGST